MAEITERIAYFIEIFEPTMLIRLPFAVRIMIGILFIVIGISGRYFVFAFWPEKKLNQDYFDDFVRPLAKPLEKVSWLLGYLLLPGNPPGENMAYTLSMALLAVEDGIEVWTQLVLMISVPILIFAFLSGIYFQRTIGRMGGTLPWFFCMENVGFGMLFLCGIELIARFIGSFDPTNGSPLYFIFHGMIMLQIFVIAAKVVGALWDFAMAFFTKNQIREMEYEIKMARREARTRSGSDTGADFSFGMPEAGAGVFPEIVYIGGEQYRLQSDSGDNANYYCPRTGETINIRDTDLPGHE